MTLSQYFPYFTTQSTSTTYYVDDLSQAAQIQSQTFDFVSDKFTQISGVYVLGGNPQPDISYQVVSVNLGRYFYPRTRLLNVISDPAGTTVLDINITDLSASNNAGAVPMISPITMTAASPLPLDIADSITGIFAKALPLKITPYNISAAGSQNPTSVPVIIDAPSVYLIKTTLAQNIPDATAGPGNGFVMGCRVGSGRSNPAIKVPDVSEATYNEWNLYDNTLDLSAVGTYPAYAAEDLQICNGAFRTAASAASGTVGYLNYTTYLRAPGGLLNPYNYTAIASETTKYRWATFVWKIGTLSNSTTYSVLNFKIDTPTPTSLTYDPATYQLYTDSGKTNEILLYYRFEQQSNQIPQNTISPTTKSTVWIKALGADTGAFASRMALWNQNGVLGGNQGGSGVGFDPATNQYNKLIMSPITPNAVGSEVYIYTRIGVPMRSLFSFRGISCSIMPA